MRFIEFTDYFGGYYFKDFDFAKHFKVLIFGFHLIESRYHFAGFRIFHEFVGFQIIVIACWFLSDLCVFTVRLLRVRAFKFAHSARWWSYEVLNHLTLSFEYIWKFIITLIIDCFRFDPMSYCFFVIVIWVGCSDCLFPYYQPLYFSLDFLYYLIEFL